MTDFKDETSNHVVWILLALLFVVFVLLVYFYKKLNRQTDNQYTIHQLVYGEGGARDWVRDRVRRLEVLSGRRLWLLSENAMDAREEGDQEGYVEKGSKGGESQNDEQEGGGDESSDDYSSLGGVDLVSKKVTDVKEERRGSRGSRGSRASRGSRGRRQDDHKDDGESEAGAAGGEESGRGGLLVDLHPFSGSAIWSEDKQEGGRDSEDVTAL
ncbi:hypothetical protein UPYG_G00240970 [Umbra pygmaea]|uniref:Uncharacterized protein n=1 Tax=Umbra pygmaea TaxID=75934 RepID=A0ABD0X1H1_UMBPY